MISSTIIALLGVGIAVLSLTVSSLTMYFVWLRRGQLAMTKPALVFFGHDTVPKLTPKIFLRALLYSTTLKGQVIESLYAKLHRGDTSHIFGVWGYGATTIESQGSGLYVGQSGVTLNHHFVLSEGHGIVFELNPEDQTYAGRIQSRH